MNDGLLIIGCLDNGSAYGEVYYNYATKNIFYLSVYNERIILEGLTVDESSLKPVHYQSLENSLVASDYNGIIVLGDDYYDVTDNYDDTFSATLRGSNSAPIELVGDSIEEDDD